MNEFAVFAQHVTRKLAVAMNTFQLGHYSIEIERQKAVIVTRTGRVGGQALETREDFSSETAAKRVIKKRLAELQKRGFRKIAQPKGHLLQRDQTEAVIRIVQMCMSPTMLPPRSDKDWEDANNIVRMFASFAELFAVPLSVMADTCIPCASAQRWAATARWFAGDIPAPDVNVWWSFFHALMEPVAGVLLACLQGGHPMPLPVSHEELQGAAGTRGYGGFQRAGTSSVKRWAEDVKRKWSRK